MSEVIYHTEGSICVEEARLAGKRKGKKNTEGEDDKAEREQFRGKSARKPWEPRYGNKNWDPLTNRRARVS